MPLTISQDRFINEVQACLKCSVPSPICRQASPIISSSRGKLLQPETNWAWKNTCLRVTTEITEGRGGRQSERLRKTILTILVSTVTNNSIWRVKEMRIVMIVWGPKSSKSSRLHVNIIMSSKTRQGSRN